MKNILTIDQLTPEPKLLISVNSTEIFGRAFAIVLWFAGYKFVPIGLVVSTNKVIFWLGSSSDVEALNVMFKNQ